MSFRKPGYWRTDEFGDKHFKPRIEWREVEYFDKYDDEFVGYEGVIKVGNTTKPERFWITSLPNGKYTMQFFEDRPATPLPGRKDGWNLGAREYFGLSQAKDSALAFIDAFDRGKDRRGIQRFKNPVMDYSPNALFGALGAMRLLSAFQVLTGLPVSGVSKSDARAIIKQMTAVQPVYVGEYSQNSSLEEFLDTHASLAVETGQMDLDEPYAWAVPYAEKQGFYGMQYSMPFTRENPKKDRMYLFHIAHRGTAYFGLGPNPRIAKRKLTQQLKGTGLTADSPNVLGYDIDYNSISGEGWNSKI